MSLPRLVEKSADERLEGNIKCKPKKRYFTETTKRKGSPVKDVNFDDEYKTTTNDNKLPDFNTGVEFNRNVQGLIPHSDDYPNNTAFTSGKQNNIDKNTPLMLSASKTKNYQNKLGHQRCIGMKSISPSIDQLISTPIFQSSKIEGTVKNVNCTIKVRVKDALFLVSIPADKKKILN